MRASLERLFNEYRKEILIAGIDKHPDRVALSAYIPLNMAKRYLVITEREILSAKEFWMDLEFYKGIRTLSKEQGAERNVHSILPFLKNVRGTITHLPKNSIPKYNQEMFLLSVEEL